MSALWIAAHVVALLVWPVILTGVVNRTKARWAGRKGPPLLQTLYDVLRLMRKNPVYSATTTPVFWVAPYVLLATALVSGILVPFLGRGALVSFRFDFVFFAYAWGLGRVAMMLAALDTGSAFEGMGASREATFSGLAEPALFLALGSLAAATGESTFAGLLDFRGSDPALAVVRAGCLVALALLLQVESARIPVDDPTTHLELTMVHEVMILDHSGPDLAAMQYAAALKLGLSCAILAALINPFTAMGAGVMAAANLGIMVLIAVVVGTVESVIARLQLRAVPRYVLVAIAGAVVALFASTWGAA